MQDELPWSFVIELASVPAEGKVFELRPDDESRARLAEAAEVVSVPALIAKLKVRPIGAGAAEVTGLLEGAVRQHCVVSLEEFENKISEAISVDFAENPESEAESDDEEEIEDLPDPIIDGKIDLGALATEFLILAIDPYPRKPGATLEHPAAVEEPVEAPKTPFEQLSALKDKLKK